MSQQANSSRESTRPSCSSRSWPARRIARRARRTWTTPRARPTGSRRLFAEGLVAGVDLKTAKYKYSVTQASYKVAQVNLDSARRNLTYSAISAPIDGVVIARNVDVGQTVAASLSAPILFVIAQDLTKMQILASVDESDIGRVHENQTVRFTVQSFPNVSFVGKVSQVRLQSAIAENVVSYTAVVAVDNTDRTPAAGDDGHGPVRGRFGGGSAQGLQFRPALHSLGRTAAEGATAATNPSGGQAQQDDRLRQPRAGTGQRECRRLRPWPPLVPGCSRQARIDGGDQRDQRRPVHPDLRD